MKFILTQEPNPRQYIFVDLVKLVAYVCVLNKVIFRRACSSWIYTLQGGIVLHWGHPRKSKKHEYDFVEYTYTIFSILAAIKIY